MSRSVVVKYVGVSSELVFDSEMGIIEIPREYVCPPDYSCAVEKYPEMCVDESLRGCWFEIPSDQPRSGFKYKVSSYRCVSSEDFVSFSAVYLEFMAMNDFFLGYAGLMEACRQIPAAFVDGIEFIAVDRDYLTPGVRRLADGQLHLRGYEYYGTKCDCQTTRFLRFRWAGH